MQYTIQLPSLQEQWDQIKANAESGANSGGLSWICKHKGQSEPSAICGFWLNMIFELQPSGIVMVANDSRGPWHNTGIQENWDVLKARAEKF